MKELKILFTSVGRRVELMQAFVKAADELNANVTLFGADITESAPALAFCDRTVIVKRIKDPEYIPCLLEICERERIDALIPTIDTDLLILAQNRNAFEQIGTKVLVANEDKIQLCRDKRLTADYFISCGLNSPKPVDDYKKYTGGFPAFIKPKDGSSSINAYKINNEQELETYSARVDDYIIQPFIDGREYTIDAFCDLDGNPLLITPRERIAVRSGEVLKTRICQDDVMIDECRRLLADFKPRGAITVQLIKQTQTGKNYYIEINPRYGGGAPLSIKAGADSAKECIKMLLGKDTCYIEKAAKDNAVYSRFDQSVCISGKNEAIKIDELSSVNDVVSDMEAVIFDLDDTLYSEKEYVRNGYKAVAELLGDAAFEDRLWAFFEEGRPAIDCLLEEEGLTEKKAKCLEAYRNCVPVLSLYDNAREVLLRLKEKGVKTGIITDGRPEGQRNKLSALGLYEMVDEIIITDELGGAQFRKPCDIAFRIMQKRLNVAFEKIVYIGDNASKDFKAPLRLGMRAIHFLNKDGLYQHS